MKLLLLKMVKMRVLSQNALPLFGSQEEGKFRSAPCHLSGVGEVCAQRPTGEKCNKWNKSCLFLCTRTGFSYCVADLVFVLRVTGCPLSKRTSWKVCWLPISFYSVYQRWCLWLSNLVCFLCVRFQIQNELDRQRPRLQCPESVAEGQRPALQRRLWCCEGQSEELQQVRRSRATMPDDCSQKNGPNVHMFPRRLTFPILFCT